MQVFIERTYEEISALAASHLEQFMMASQHPLICVASGDSPAGLYRQLARDVQEGKISVKDWHFVGLDEWMDMNGEDEGSCRYHLDQQLFGPLQVQAGQVHFFDGRAEDLNKECIDVEHFIRDHHGIDVAVIGLGLNGHIGMNEPGSDPGSRAHIAELAPQTIETAQKYFTRPTTIRGGITLGIATIMESRDIFLLVSGAKKAAIVKQVLEGEISPEVPASLLRNHPGARIYLDRDAASLLNSNGVNEQ
ncbi:glucosamine-6-phosphate deaminase [Flavihumibacter rivuli]|uniref:glucosamine-6-phosphate deaminase n=1 Tax=Flavihumibacter rivuli TaxID=2838156 RepID=UPI001BDEDCF1|nr:glucosamine-6-phosphate deaminase [Flavihumibacter rivuli]ULQ54889.1 glucosamine-6-phosphate deaminase [Flavihumibacter rivuli]